MTNLNSLELELIQSRHIKFLDFIELLRAFDKVIKSYFGMDLLPSYEEDIAAYKVIYEKDKLNVTTKAHIVIEDVAPFCKKTNKGSDIFLNTLGKYLLTQNSYKFSPFS